MVCPKQDPKIECDVLFRVGIISLFYPNQGQDLDTVIGTPRLVKEGGLTEITCRQLSRAKIDRLSLLLYSSSRAAFQQDVNQNKSLYHTHPTPRQYSRETKTKGFFVMPHC